MNRFVPLVLAISITFASTSTGSGLAWAEVAAPPSDARPANTDIKPDAKPADVQTSAAQDVTKPALPSAFETNEPKATEVKASETKVEEQKLAPSSDTKTSDSKQSISTINDAIPTDIKVPPRPQQPEIIRVNEKRTNLLLFNTGTEAISGNIAGAADVLMLGSIGTVLSTDMDRLVLHTGRLVLDTGKTQLALSTRLASVTIRPNSAVVIEVHPRKPVRIMAIGGANQDDVMVKTRGKRGQIIWLKPGEEVVITDSVLPKEDLLPSDGVARQELTMAIQAKGLDIRKMTFNDAQMAAQETQRLDASYRLGGDKRSGLNRLVSHVVQGAQVAEPKFTPVKAGQSSGGSGGDPLHIMAEGGTEFTIGSDGAIKLRTGFLFIHAPRIAEVDTAVGQAFGDKDALFCVGASATRMRVLACSGPDDVWAVVGDHKLSVAPGQEVLICDHDPKDEDKMPPDGIGRRDLTTRKLTDDFSVTYADFSIVSLLFSQEHLKTVRQGLKSVDKDILERLERAAAAINTITAAKGPYKSTPKSKPSNAPAKQQRPV